MTPTTLSTTTTDTPPALESPGKALEQWHSMPGQSTVPQQCPWPLPLHPEPPLATTTLQPATAAMPVATTSETMARVSSSTQMTANPLEMHCEATNGAQKRSTAQEMELCSNEQTHSLEHVVYLMELFCQPLHLQRWSRTLPR